MGNCANSIEPLVSIPPLRELLVVAFALALARDQGEADRVALDGARQAVSVETSQWLPGTGSPLIRDREQRRHGEPAAFRLHGARHALKPAGTPPVAPSPGHPLDHLHAGLPRSVKAGPPQ